MAVMSFALWSLVKEQQVNLVVHLVISYASGLADYALTSQTHDLEDHMKLMGTVIDAKVAKIREFKQMYV